MSKAVGALAAIALFTACLVIFTRGNDFPFHYHPDERGKVQQVISGEWNFHHPMLLLSVSKLATNALRIPADEQAVVVAGRCVSAGFMALAVVMLATVAGLWGGWPAAIGTGVGLALHHQLFELAHYMKEDSALLLGIAVTFLAASLHERRPVLAYAALLGVGAGLATAGKYIGIISLAIAVPVLWNGPERSRRIVAFVGAFAVVFIAANLPLLADLHGFRASFDREMDLVVKGQAGMTRRVPHLQYWNVFIDNTTPVIWVLLLVFFIQRWRNRREISRVQWMLIAFPVIFAVALSFSPKSNDRYFLPATAILITLAAVGTADAAHWIPHERRPTWAVSAMAALLILAQIPSFHRYHRAFQQDDNAELIEWLRSGRDVPANAVISRDSRVWLHDPASDKGRMSRLPPVQQRILSAKFAADNGTLDEQRAKGVTHVAVSESDYGRFFIKSLRPQKSEETDFLRRKAFYESLLRADPPIRLIFDRERGTVIYLHPGIRVYRIVP